MILLSLLVSLGIIGRNSLTYSFNETSLLLYKCIYRYRCIYG